MWKINTANLPINNSDATSNVPLRNIFETESREMSIQMASVSVINEFVCERQQSFIARLMGILMMDCFFVMNNGTEIMEFFFFF